MEMRFGSLLWNVPEGAECSTSFELLRNLGQVGKGFCNCLEMREIKVNQGRSRWITKKRKGDDLLDKPWSGEARREHLRSV